MLHLIKIEKSVFFYENRRPKKYQLSEARGRMASPIGVCYQAKGRGEEKEMGKKKTWKYLAK